MALADTDPLRTAFESQEPILRRSVQVELQMGDFYGGQIDGLYGPGTRTALIRAANFVANASGGQFRYDLNNPAEARRYIADLADQRLARFLWEDGNEG